MQLTNLVVSSAAIIKKLSQVPKMSLILFVLEAYNTM